MRRMTRAAVLARAAVLGAALFTTRAAAAQSSEAFHFAPDPTRSARVDDRGGLGEGYSFVVGDDGTGTNHDFCPHCRLTLFVSDPGLDLADLERVGITRSNIQSAAGLLGTLQSLAAAEPTGLAHDLAPELVDADLHAFVAEVVRIQNQASIVITALEAFALMEAGTFDWSTASYDELVTAMHLRMDTAFRADFSDPNDPRVHNSGVAVYDVPALIDGMTAHGVPAAVTSAISSTLSSIPGVSGSLEMSGDDDDVLQGASFHGYHTDLTVRQRTYVVNGVDAYLVVYTVVNETSRVFPLVEASMMADFDIPPASYDESTDFDTTTQMVMDYDVVPYTDPEVHHWFGLAPGRTGIPAPDAFGFTNWNVDQNMTLAQFGSDTTQLNRIRYLLWDPAISGDHDDALGKSEKQGAITMLLGGPLLPGDAREVAFCYALGTGGSSAAARTNLTATMSACRAVYSAISPVCGDGVRAYPEECDAPGSPACNARCQTVACGDGRVDAPEECDDGNTTAGDGCASDCVAEVCGNGVVQAGEQCDDGNASSLDACLPDCTVPRCGDGIVRASSACSGGDCGCAGYDFCLSGSFTLAEAGTDGAFSELVGVPVDFRLGFDVESTTTNALTHGVAITTGPVHVEMSGADRAATMARSLDGSTWEIDLAASPLRGGTRFRTTSLTTPGPSRVAYGFALGIESSRGVTFSVDDRGFPVLSTLRLVAGTATLAFTATVGTTLTATAPARASIGTVPAGSPGELCDDGNASDFDACTNACVPGTCGDGILQVVLGEECDEGPSPPSWCTACRRTGTSCGNGMIESAYGEACDDGNGVDGDGCSAICRVEECGDGVVQADEECDDGANGDGDGCTDLCVLERCGDQLVQPREACDDGDANADTAACLADCTLAACGDGHVEAGVEGCDDGNLTRGDGCSDTCVVERCGDGAPGPGEACDDGNDVTGDGCSSACAVEVCGDGAPGPAEQCDDANVIDGDGCDKDCQLENLDACGDGLVGPGETCDDGNTTAADGCSAYCQLEDPDACGNGSLDAGEGCDDGNTTAGDGCSALCTEERCGDAVQAEGESCDDGNVDDGDGCDALCHVEDATCGNGVHEVGEQCDGEPSCASDCTTDDGDLGTTCGDGDLDLGEACDDGGRLDGNGCDSTCQLEAAVCGNGRLERGETCEDGNDVTGDGCTLCVLDEDHALTGTGCGSCAVGARSSRGGLTALGALAALALLVRRRRR